MQAKRQIQKREAQPNKGPVAMLQEFVQCSKTFPLPPNFSALHWTYDARMACKASLEYRATAGFYLDGVPHHVAGAWQASKKGAQRDAAHRALSLFVGKWGAESMPKGSSRAHSLQCASEDEVGKVYEELLLEDFCAKFPACGGRSALQWSIQPEESQNENGHGNSCGTCFAVLELRLMGVPHKLVGAAKATEKDAIADTARRALWYLQCPGFEHAFEPEKLSIPGKALKGIQEIPSPPTGWVCDNSSEEAFEEAKRKTSVMRVQNRLQQQFARQMQQGQSVWEWSYTTDPENELWPPLFRAKVVIPVLQKEFTGDWMRGQRESQIDAISRVSEYLDEILPEQQEQPRRKELRHRNAFSDFTDSSATVSFAGSELQR